MTGYSVEDSDGTAYTIEKWGGVHEGVVEGCLATFFEVKVMEFQGNRQYQAKEIVVE